jgi:uncharacterized membrane protein YjjB (DUF3815 family)
MRKFWLGMAFLAVSGYLVYVGIKQGSDLLALSTVIGAQAAGVLAIVWGNVKEHQNGHKPQ